MFPLPVHRLIYAHLLDPLRESVGHGYSEPLPAISSLDPVAILKFIFFILHGVQQTEDITAIKLVEITQPGKILWLMDSYNRHVTANSFIL